MSWTGRRTIRSKQELIPTGVSVFRGEQFETTWFDERMSVDVQFIRFPPRGMGWPHRFKNSRWGVYSIERGTGRVSSPMGWIDVRAGDWILQSPGRPQHLINTGDSELWLLILLCRSDFTRSAKPSE